MEENTSQPASELDLVLQVQTGIVLAISSMLSPEAKLQFARGLDAASNRPDAHPAAAHFLEFLRDQVLTETSVSVVDTFRGR